MSKNDNSLEDLKFLLGSMGIDILLAIDRGAKNFETIEILSGVPLACIRGRIPVLIEFGLIVKNEEEYFITDKGVNFKKVIENQF
jgi:predicted transcriptional regulator